MHLFHPFLSLSLSLALSLSLSRARSLIFVLIPILLLSLSFLIAGLSTVISNKSKVLSVLGTPEFMAPELYDESYDERVDIYAFGMCILEMISKEIPYMECQNAAQIYKRVTNHIAPLVLERVQHGEAREFIRQCLQANPEDRPTAGDLLTHPFLETNDDYDKTEPLMTPRTVPPIIEGVREESASLNSRANSGVVQMPFANANANSVDVDENSQQQQQSANSAQQQQSQQSQLEKQHDTSSVGGDNDILGENDNGGENDANSAAGGGEEGNRRRAQTGNSIQGTLSEGGGAEGGGEEGMDQLNYRMRHNSRGSGEYTAILNTMQESEIDMKKVKVLMGRDQEICDEGESPSSLSHKAALYQAQQQQQQNNYQLQQSTVIISAAPAAQSTDTNTLQLSITMPVDGQPHQVAFDFNLINDVATEVAREMVMELQIPESGVVEIAKTIQILANKAKQKQTAHVQPNKQGAVQFQHQQNNGQQQQQQDLSASIGSLEMSQDGGQQQMSAASVVEENKVTRSAGAGGGEIININNNNSIVSGATTLMAGQQQSSMMMGGGGGGGQVGATIVVDYENNNWDHEGRESEVTNDTWNSAGGGGNESDEDIDAEFEQLSSDYQGKLQRAKKAYDTRMDNLMRSRAEREEQHRKAIEKHERELADYEKRVANAKAEQEKRLENLEFEWEKEKDGFRKNVADANIAKAAADANTADHQQQQQQNEVLGEQQQQNGGGNGGVDLSLDPTSL
jgi:hypothetical protein